MEAVNVKDWKRREHYEFFSNMANPTFGIVTEVDCTGAYRTAKEKGFSFFAYYLHKSTAAVNSVEELKYRIINDVVVRFDVIHAGTTIGREDETFGFAFIPFSMDFNEFDEALKKEIQLVNASTGLRLNDDNIKKDLIRYSTFPWNNFTGLLHPTNNDNKESVPKITFGKFVSKNERVFLPVSVEAHHGLVDGLHLAKYLQEFENQMKY